MIVVADTSPICYLLLIGEIDLLPRLYGQVTIPHVVYEELAAPKSPPIIRNWIQQHPAWLEVQDVDCHKTGDFNDRDLDALDPGEIAAILLAEQSTTSLLIVDDLLGRQVAIARGISVTGLIGVLDAAAQQGLVDLPKAVIRLKATSFRISSVLVQSLLSKHN